MSIRPNAHSSVLQTNNTYERYADRLFVPTSYPLDAERIAYWVESVERGGNADLTEYADFFARNLRHISFREFYDRLVLCALEVVEICEREGREIVALAPGGYRKSNGWVLLLVWPIIRPFVTRVITATSTLYNNEHKNWEQVSRPTLAVYCDDAAFTGGQATENVDSLHVWAGLGRYDLKLCYLIPFIGPSASWRLLRVVNAQAILLENSERLPGRRDLMVEQFGRERADELSLAAYKNKAALYWGHESECMIYFDHKLPDRVSTAQVVLALAPSYNEQTYEYGFDSLITGCDISKYTVNGNNEFFNILRNTIDRDFDAMGVCPPSYYKTIF